ncbi:MAG: photosystem II biogenesis protein Psp29 [Synechococcales cyanobacterium RM1_1_8]|nr:photosystem II biogenesis protein Psp29 [Synechococcales cyanobacterium RM1_1_8]
MNNVATVSDTKRAFYSVHARPISPLYRRVIEELLVEAHLLSVNTSFAYDPIYALGVVTGYDRFLDGYRPEADQASMFKALCAALEANPEQYRQDAQALLDGIGANDLKTVASWLAGNTAAAPSPLKETVESIAQRSLFKYSRLFAIGVYSLLEKADPDFSKQKEADRLELLNRISEGLHLPQEKLQKDIDNYVRNLDNMTQAKVVMREAVEAERKKREKREQEKQAREAAKDSEKAAEPGVDASSASAS